MKINLFNRFIIAFISVGLIPILFISTYSAYLFQRETRLILEDNYRATAFYAARNLDSLIEKYNTITKLLYSYSAASSGIIRRIDGLGFAEILKSPVDSHSAGVIRHNDIINFLHLIYTSDHYITNVIFIENNPNLSDNVFYTFGHNNRPFVDREKFIPLTNRVSERVNQLFVIPTHQDDYFQKRPVDVFTIGRNYIDLSYPLGSEPVLGTLYMDINVQVIGGIFNQLGLYGYNEIRIMDADDNVIYSNDVYTRNYLEITESCSLSGWRVNIRIDMDRITRNIMNLIRLLYIIVIAVLLILLVLSIVYSNVFSRPIKAILRGMKQVEEGNFNIQLHIKGQDEIKLLADGFMQMTTKLENYIQTSILSKLRLKEAELSALRARIKPHFIYNSLEIIRMNAIANNDESTADLTFHLAEFMHTLIEPGHNEVHLSKELNLLKSYLAFIDIRYEHKIMWKINVKEELLRVRVLSLMIQPVVENAIIHGIIPKGKGIIDINIFTEEDVLVITISDNGVGMDEILKERLTTQLESVSQETEAKQEVESIGLKNVHDRLHYTYGNSYGVSIESNPGEGTVITMTLPFKLYGGENGNV